MHFGYYRLRGVDFWFVFDGNILVLYPKDEANKKLAMCLTHKELNNGLYAYPGEAIEVNSPLVLSVHLQDELLILYPISTTYIVDDHLNGTLSLQVGSWFVAEETAKFSGLSINSDILDCAYDIQGAVDSSSLDANGRIVISSTRKEGHSFKFCFDGVEIEGYLSHARGVSFKNGELPIKIRSQLSLSFPETTDYVFLKDLIRTMHDFLAFIAQGYGYQYDEIKMLRRFHTDNGSYFSEHAKFFENGRKCGCKCPKKLIALKNNEDLARCIFQALGDEKLVLEHLPQIIEKESYNASRLIMMLAALDKTMEMIYPGKIEYSQEGLESRNAINNALDALIADNASSRLKSDVAWLKKTLRKSESLQSRICKFAKDHKAIFSGLSCDVFETHKMRIAFFKRITAARNKIAHGDFDAFKDYSFDDIEGTNQLLLAVQLVLIGIESDGEIAAIVNGAYS